MASRRGALAAPLGVLLACGGGGTTAPPVASHGGDAGGGRVVYETRCAPCHGLDGAGDGPAAAAISPKPRNFRDPAFWNGRTPGQLRLVIEQGKPGTLMAPFAGALSPAEIDDVVAYLQSFRPAGS